MRSSITCQSRVPLFVLPRCLYRRKRPERPRPGSAGRPPPALNGKAGFPHRTRSNLRRRKAKSAARLPRTATPKCTAVASVARRRQ
ncbi:hypothetical protein KCP73_18670 [Salmonella enterica subsp. enterica]|nr:hypothetical protein KCP73_18670 [Salmonella enterica subsp. enterica]